MEQLWNLLLGAPDEWSGGIAHSILILAVAIASGIALGKVRVGGVSLGSVWILFVGILFGYLDIGIDSRLLLFLKEAGLILFVYSIGMQVGPGFFAPFRKGGLQLNAVALTVVGAGVAVAVVLHQATGGSAATLIGVLSGTAANAPGLGAAQEAAAGADGSTVSDMALGYALACPLGIVGCISMLWVLKHVFRVNAAREEAAADAGLWNPSELKACSATLEIRNRAVEGMTLSDTYRMVGRSYVISYVRDAAGHTEMATDSTTLHVGDRILLVSTLADMEAISVFFGRRAEEQWEEAGAKYVSRAVFVTRPRLNGLVLGQLDLHGTFGVNITHVRRSGIDLVATPELRLQMGDRLMIAGQEVAVNHVRKFLGDSPQELKRPNLFFVFFGIALGCILGSLPLSLPDAPQPLRLGLAGGTLIVSILIARFGINYRLVTYVTDSAGMMLQKVGLSLFLACTGLETGKAFIESLVEGNAWLWAGCGLLLTAVPLLAGGIVGRRVFGMNYYTLAGVLSGAMTSPPALSYVNDRTAGDAPSVGYASVYPLALFVRVLAAQLPAFAWI